MSQPTQSLIFYVRHPAESAAFYSQLLGRAPVDASPNFVMFALGEQLMLGLWARHDVVPAATPPGGAELCLTLPDRDAVQACLARWRGLGAAIVQEPTEMDFGYTFSAVDPDGHRLRVFSPTPEPAA